jgi:hypothetical protein
MWRTVAVLVLFCAMQSAGAREIEKVNFTETTSLHGQTIALNGVGLRVKRKFGMGFKVYVAARYGKKPTEGAQAQAWLTSSEPMVLELVFLRGIGADTLKEAWQEGFAKNCAQACQSEAANLKAFNELMAGVKEGSRLRLEFDAQGTEVHLTAKKDTHGRIEGAGFRKALLAIFIGESPPTEDLKKGLLGNQLAEP